MDPRLIPPAAEFPRMTKQSGVYFISLISENYAPRII